MGVIAGDCRNITSEPVSDRSHRLGYLRNDAALCLYGRISYPDKPSFRSQACHTAAHHCGVNVFIPDKTADSIIVYRKLTVFRHICHIQQTRHLGHHIYYDVQRYKRREKYEYPLVFKPAHTFILHHPMYFSNTLSSSFDNSPWFFTYSSKRSGLRSLVNMSDCSNLHSAIALWLPERRISGTSNPPYDLG